MEKKKERNLFATMAGCLFLFQLIGLAFVFFGDMSLDAEGNLFLAVILLSVPIIFVSIIAFYKSFKLPTKKGRTTSAIALVIEIPLAILFVSAIKKLFDEGTVIPVSSIVIFGVVCVITAVIVILLLKYDKRQLPTADDSDNQSEGDQKKTCNPKDTFLSKIRQVAAKKSRVVKGCVAIAVIILGVLALTTSPKKSFAIDCATELQSILKDPTSLLIRGDVIVCKNADGEMLAKINYSAANSYGGMNANVAYFSENWGYLGDNDTDVDEMNSFQKDDYIDARLHCGIAESIGTSSANAVSGKSVAKAIGCKYFVN